MRNFRKLNIWIESVELAKEVYQLSVLLPKDEKYGLKSQICRSVVSIPSNIAEGCSSFSAIYFRRYLIIAIGSSFELETQLILIKEMHLIREENIIKPLNMLDKIQKMINSMIQKLQQ